MSGNRSVISEGRIVEMRLIKKGVLISLAATFLFSCTACGGSAASVETGSFSQTTPTKTAEQNVSVSKKVIFDTDMMYANDDAAAMFMLTQADESGELDLLGITTVGGNVFAANATTAVLRQLELIGRSDIPVCMGTDVPLGGFRDMQKEDRLYGTPDYCGAYWDFEKDQYSDPNQRPMDYMKLESEPEYGYPKTRALEQEAWEFMSEQVHKYPGEVTILAVGAATNVATAIQKDPAFVQDAAGIIYMGGDIDVPGNATPAAELNWFYDPRAIKICLAADWKSQIVVPDDLARQIFMEQEIYDRIRELGKHKISELILEKEDVVDPTQPKFVWDVVVPAVILKPEIINDLQTRYLTVDDRPGINSGRAVSWVKNSYNNPETGKGMPEGVRPVQILMSIHEDIFWDFFVEILTRE